MHLPRTVDIREVGLRDGLQLEEPVPTQGKLAILEAVAATGVSRVEVTSIVSPRAVRRWGTPSRSSQSSAVGPRYISRHWLPAPGGARRAVDAGMPNPEYVTSASDGHSEANADRSSAQAVAAVGDIAAMAAAAAVVEQAVGHPLTSNLYRAGGRSRPHAAAR